jgi:hypothetical protein
MYQLLIPRNAASKLASFCSFSFTVDQSRIHWPLTTGHWPLFSRPTLHAEASGVKSCADSPRWLLPSTDIRIGKDRTGHDLDERSLFVSMSPKFSMLPNQAISSDKSIRFSPLAGARSLTIRSWPERSTPAAPDEPAGCPKSRIARTVLVSLPCGEWTARLYHERYRVRYKVRALVARGHAAT